MESPCAISSRSLIWNLRRDAIDKVRPRIEQRWR
jgi:hypothetical protein